MDGISVVHSRDGSITVDLRGEFDLSTVEALRETLSRVASFRCPTVIDLSNVTFMDVQSTRELAVRCHLYAHHVTLLNPSWQVRQSVEACKLGEWVRFEDPVEEPLAKVS
ncbi:hypothetical protein BH23ACT11_BH23ACT11_31060 [soil metagenome]